MTHYDHEIAQLLQQAEVLADGPAKVALIERAVHVADAHGDVRTAFKIRVRLLGAALSSGQSDVLLVAFSWCLAQSELDPQVYPEIEILWQFRWVISELVEFSHVTKTQLEELFADMHRRYEKAGSTMRPYFVLRRMTALDMGDRAAAMRYHQQVGLCPRDWLSDGADAEASFLVDYLLFIGQEDEALALGRKFLAGRAGSAHHRGFLCAKLLLPLLKHGHLEEAAQLHREGYRMIAGNARYVPRFAEHLKYLALTKDFPRGFRLLERHVGEAASSVSDYSRLHFYLSAQLLLERVAELGRTTLRLRLPKNFPQWTDDSRYDGPELAKWFGEQALECARRFDARNGNDFFQTECATLHENNQWASVVILGKPKPDTGREL